MTRSEFISWMQFYRRWPFDDYHRFHRPAALIAGCTGGEDMQKLLDFLQPPVRKPVSELDTQLMAAFGYEVT
jgi:hypothetical protein